jgi:hypothetical protein
MVIVAGHVTVDPEQRESYLAGLRLAPSPRIRSGPIGTAEPSPLQIPLNGGRGECGQSRTFDATHTTGGDA